MPDKQLILGEDENAVALRRAWERALRDLSGRVSRVTYESYLRPVRPIAYDGETVVLGVPNAFAREWLEKRHVLEIRAAIEAALGTSAEVVFKVASDQPAIPEFAIDTPESPAPRETKRPARGPARLSPVSQPVTERLVFGGFIVGRTNRLAHAAAVAVAEAPGQRYNPLFIYGGSGHGKTHLLHAIGNALLRSGNSVRIALLDGESFTHQYVEALREKRMDEFRRSFRSIDAWLVDDVQFIAGKTGTNEEFFHTFNALYQSGKQIVLCSDRSPRDLHAMDERLRSRFECGLIADVHPPELETRVAILEKRCLEEGWTIPSDVLFFVADSIQSNMRALEGAVTKLIAYHSIMRAPIDLELARSVLGEFFIERPVRAPRKYTDPESVLAAVAERFGVTKEAMVSSRRERTLVDARQIAIYLIRELCGLSLAQTGALLGRDHSTAQRAAAKVEATLLVEANLQKTVRDLRRTLER